MSVLQIPTEEELHAEYRELRMKTIWGCCRELHPDIWTFTGTSDRDIYNGGQKVETVILKLDVFLDEVHFDGDRVVSVPSISDLHDGLFAAMAKIALNLVFSIDLLRDDNFVKIMFENKSRFARIYVWHSDEHKEMDIKNLGVSRLQKTKRWRFNPKYKATSADIKREFKQRLDEAYSAIFGWGIGLLLCIVTCPVGALMICGGLILLPIDTIVTGINYKIVKCREKLQ